MTEQPVPRKSLTISKTIFKRNGRKRIRKILGGFEKVKQELADARAQCQEEMLDLLESIHKLQDEVVDLKKERERAERAMTGIQSLLSGE